MASPAERDFLGEATYVIDTERQRLQYLDADVANIDAAVQGIAERAQRATPSMQSALLCRDLMRACGAIAQGMQLLAEQDPDGMVPANNVRVAGAHRRDGAYRLTSFALDNVHTKRGVHAGDITGTYTENNTINRAIGAKEAHRNIRWHDICSLTEGMVRMHLLTNGYYADGDDYRQNQIKQWATPEGAAQVDAVAVSAIDMYNRGKFSDISAALDRWQIPKTEEQPRNFIDLSDFHEE